jgi:hypothetical protein
MWRSSVTPTTVNATGNAARRGPSSRNPLKSTGGSVLQMSGGGSGSFSLGSPPGVGTAGKHATLSVRKPSSRAAADILSTDGDLALSSSGQHTAEGALLSLGDLSESGHTFLTSGNGQPKRDREGRNGRERGQSPGPATQIQDFIRPRGNSPGPGNGLSLSTLSLIGSPTRKSRPSFLSLDPLHSEAPLGANTATNVGARVASGTNGSRAKTPRLSGIAHPSVSSSSSSASMGGAGSVSASSGSSDAVVDLLYDPILNCYFDPTTTKYYELQS